MYIYIYVCMYVYRCIIYIYSMVYAIILLDSKTFLLEPYMIIYNICETGIIVYPI